MDTTMTPVSPTLLWAIEMTGSPEADEDSIAILKACEELSVASYTFSLGLNAALPEIPISRPVVFWCPIATMLRVHREDHWKPGVFWNGDAFRYTRALQEYGALMLNHGAERASLAEFSTRPLDENKRFMLRPDSDSKELNGGVWKFGDLLRLVEAEKRQAGGTAKLELPVIIAKPRDIDHEWRLFMVDGSVVSGSRYMSWGELSISPQVPAEVISFAERASARWSPARAFVMDIAAAEGALFILEINGFNSSGLYACNPRAIVAKVTSMLA